MKQKLTLTFCGIEVQNPELGICSIPLACLTYFMKINPPKKQQNAVTKKIIKSIEPPLNPPLEPPPLQPVSQQQGDVKENVYEKEN